MKCKSCNHQWIPRIKNKNPTNCPLCRKLLNPLPRGRQIGFKVKLNLNKKILSCLRCGYKWNPLGKDPFSCPKCKTSFWNKKRLRF